jgi:hypothetical protein
MQCNVEAADSAHRFTQIHTRFARRKNITPMCGVSYCDSTILRILRENVGVFSQRSAASARNLKLSGPFT